MLPDPCPKCAPYGGTWMLKESDAGEGLARCDCPRGQALVQKSAPPVYRPPVLAPDFTTVCVESLSAIPYFPTEAGARAAIQNQIAAMCKSEADALWLCARMVALYKKWPGVPEMRLVLCNGRKPLDAIEATGESEYYPDGIPSERPPAAPPKQLPGSREPLQISGAPSIDATVHDLAVKTDLNNFGAPAKVREIPVRKLNGAERITPAMVRQAEEEYRAAKARQELGLEQPVDSTCGWTRLFKGAIVSIETGSPG
jgi:hypothetical protein